MQSEEIRKRFLEFFKANGHTIMPSASLVPENDPTVLFITAGMQPLVPFLRGREHPGGRRLANIQKCVRTQDIEEVGDATHDTFFEMMGNWSLGDYFKEEAIRWSYELLTDRDKGFGLDPQRLYVTVYAGDDQTPRDEEAAKIWQEMGIPKHRIYYLGADSNWWPNVKGKDTWTGPTGPSTEMFYDLTPEGLGDLSHEGFLEADDKQQLVEIWNDVFMAYDKEAGVLTSELSQKNVDTGAGLERIAMVLQKKDNIFDTDLFSGLMSKLSELGAIANIKGQRIVADHIRTSVFMIADGVTPANTDRGYILRRLIRRAVRYADVISLPPGKLGSLVDPVINKYGQIYPNLIEQAIRIQEEIGYEESKFRDTLQKGLKEFSKIDLSKPIDGGDAFKLVTTFGFPLELIQELAAEKGQLVDLKSFYAEMDKHKEVSKAGSEQRFKGGLADTSEMSVKYHTATHLLHQALKDVLGPEVSQKGSNITPDRLRFDFVFDRKLTDEEKDEVETIVNNKIQENLSVGQVILPKEEAEKTGAHHLFSEKYGDTVSIYYIGSDIESAYSKEFCGGPHTTSTGNLGKFRIVKEESVAKGVRRIKAVLE